MLKKVTKWWIIPMLALTCHGSENSADTSKQALPAAVKHVDKKKDPWQQKAEKITLLASENKWKDVMDICGNDNWDEWPDRFLIDVASGRAQARAALNDDAGARKDFEVAEKTAIVPAAKARVLMAQANSFRKDRPFEIATLERAGKLKCPMSSMNLIVIRLAELYCKDKKFDEAKKILDSYPREKDSHAESRILKLEMAYIDLCLAMGNNEEALKHYEVGKKLTDAPAATIKALENKLEKIKKDK